MPSLIQRQYSNGLSTAKSDYTISPSIKGASDNIDFDKYNNGRIYASAAYSSAFSKTTKDQYSAPPEVLTNNDVDGINQKASYGMYANIPETNLICSESIFRKDDGSRISGHLTLQRAHSTGTNGHGECIYEIIGFGRIRCPAPFVEDITRMMNARGTMSKYFGGLKTGGSMTSMLCSDGNEYYGFRPALE
jgi:hypothetical protein